MDCIVSLLVQVMVLTEAVLTAPSMGGNKSMGTHIANKNTKQTELINIFLYQLWYFR